MHQAATVVKSDVPTKFWLVWNSKGKCPRHRHKSLASAITEADRLAVATPGRRLYVIEAIGYVDTGPRRADGSFGPAAITELELSQAKEATRS